MQKVSLEHISCFAYESNLAGKAQSTLCLNRPEKFRLCKTIYSKTHYNKTIKNKLGEHAYQRNHNITRK